MNEPTVRTLLYSHDSQGLGHVRRNLTIAHHIAKEIPTRLGCDTSGLLVSGLAPARVFPLPEGFDWVTIPGISKGKQGYQPRSLGGSTEHLIRLRSNLLRSTLISFAPDLVIIDRHIYGVWKELFSPLQQLRETLPETKIVLGLREILDEPAAAKHEWEQLGNPEQLRNIVDEVWVYGDEAVHDPTLTGEIPEFFHDRIRFTGYLANGRRLADHDMQLAPEPFILTTAGGGSDGFQLLQAAVQLEVPEDHTHIVVTGPQLSAGELAEIQELAGPRTQVHHSWPGLSTQIERASAVIAMGGYNTVCEILCTNTPGLLIPREQPRLEQLIRAQSLQRVNALDYVHLRDVSPDFFSSWVTQVMQHTTDRSHLRRDGLKHAAFYAADLVEKSILKGSTP
ncbi:MAG: glycosyltransferase [Corynebacterium sp.]|nr:glycosyltransferase [Corynebacterium sp.]